MSQVGHIAMWNWVAVILLFVQQGCALSFGTQRGTDDDTLFYGSIAFAVVMAIMLVCLIIGIIRVRKLLMKANREPDMRTKLGYENNIDSIIFDESDMVPIPRVKTLSMKKNKNDESKDFDDSSGDEKPKKKKKKDNSSEKEKPRRKSKKYKSKDYDDSSEDEKQKKKKKRDDSSEEEKPRRKSKKYKYDSSEEEKTRRKSKKYDSSDSDDSSEDENQKKNRDDSSGEEKPRRKSKKREELQTKTRDCAKKQDTNQARSGRRFANKFPQKA